MLAIGLKRGVALVEIVTADRVLAERREILECLRTPGDDCYTLKVAAASMPHLEELVNVCDRVLIVYGGRVVRELRDDGLTLERVLASILGSDSSVEVA